MEFFVQIIYFLFITYTDLLFWKNHLQTVTKSSIKIYVDISSNPPSPLVENCRFFGNPPSPPVRLRRKWMTPYKGFLHSMYIKLYEIGSPNS